ncbi:type IV secretory system conjugative DNA transfer family protein [Streptomyces cacaoi]|uniref:type IV secretory system conjugative DNA transfer family protein n=1 Tax=Streptomyces cacaoi TaxID=1898 RepID=UPI0011F20BA0|nr:type IV secretory system conjugative DNA transfer family protein [Streptomyces cacaoi]
MSTPVQTVPNAQPAERAAAIAQVFLPIGAGLLAPALDPSAAAAASAAFVAGATFAGANYMNRLGRWANVLPGIDIARAHRDTMGISTITTGMSLTLGLAEGWEGADILMAGALDPVSVPGILSLGWWAAVGLVGYRLRRVFGRHRRPVPQQASPARPNSGPPAPVTPAEKIMAAWERTISDPDKGQHRHQALTDVTVYLTYWTGRIIAPAGTSVNVTREAVSSVYRVNPDWISFGAGDHAGEARITVSYVQPTELNPDTLEGAWTRVQKRVLPKTHLARVEQDPNTGGQSALVEADDDLDALPRTVELGELAGALRRSVDLVSYEPKRNPRQAIVRVMDSNPLEAGHPFEGLESLKATPGGWVNVGKIVSGYPARLQLYDRKLGALHVIVAGATGSGKGGALQVISLAYHANGMAQIYADPKGASNPALPRMAAYSGLGNYNALGAMRLSWWVLQHRIEEAARLELKNFEPSASRPYCATILDEAAQKLGPGAVNRKEAVKIVKDGASLGRSLGLPWVLANQTMNLDQIGGEQAIRANLLTGGTWVILRTDSDQVNLGDLPEGFGGVDPSLIPPVWADEDDSLVYDPSVEEGDPRRTFGLGYIAAPGGRAGMMRIATLEDATPYIQPDHIAAPLDVPWWGDEAEMEERAMTPIPGFEEKGEGDEDGPETGEAGPRFAGVDLPKTKERTASEKILDALRDESDPLYVDALDQDDDISPEDIDYVPRGDLLTATGLNDSTFANNLKALEAAGKIHRITEGKTTKVALGPAPATSSV